MADNGKVSEEPFVVSDWDILSLASSTYTAPPCRREFDSFYVPEYGDVSSSRQGPFPGLFMSDDFVFPPSEHENLPIESEFDDLNTDNDGLEGSCAAKLDEECNMPDKGEVDDDGSLSTSSDLTSADEITSSNAKSPQIHANQEKDNRMCKSNLPCEAWWKRHSSYLYQHIKGAKTICSIVAAGALMGIVILNQRWQQDKWHLHQFHFSISSESMNRILGVFSRWKDGLSGVHQIRTLVPSRVVSQSL